MTTTDEEIERVEREVRVPKWGLTIEQVRIVNWLVKPGDHVDEGDALCEVETEKSSADIESPEDGTVVRLVAEPGAEVAVGEPVCVLELG